MELNAQCTYLHTHTIREKNSYIILNSSKCVCSSFDVFIDVFFLFAVDIILSKHRHSYAHTHTVMHTYCFFSNKILLYIGHCFRHATPLCVLCVLTDFYFRSAYFYSFSHLCVYVCAWYVFCVHIH